MHIIQTNGTKQTNNGGDDDDEEEEETVTSWPFQLVWPTITPVKESDGIIEPKFGDVDLPSDHR